MWPVFEKYLQIQSNTHKNYKKSRDRMFFTPGQVALRKLAYRVAGQTLASINGKSIKLIYSHNK